MIDFSEILPQNQVTVLRSERSGRREIGKLVESWHTKIWQMNDAMLESWRDLPAIYRGMVIEKLAELNAGWFKTQYGNRKINRAWRGTHCQTVSKGKDLEIIMPAGTQSAVARSHAFGDREYPAKAWPDTTRYKREDVLKMTSAAEGQSLGETLRDPLEGKVTVSRAVIPYEEYLEMAEWPQGSGNLVELTMNDTRIMDSGALQQEVIFAPARWTLDEMTSDYCAWLDLKDRHNLEKKKSERETTKIKERLIKEEMIIQDSRGRRVLDDDGIDVGKTVYKVCDRWLHGFEAFICDLGSRPKGKVLRLKAREKIKDEAPGKVQEVMKIDDDKGCECRIYRPGRAMWDKDEYPWEMFPLKPRLDDLVTYPSGSGLMINTKKG